MFTSRISLSLLSIKARAILMVQGHAETFQNKCPELVLMTFQASSKPLV